MNIPGDRHPARVDPSEKAIESLSRAGSLIAIGDNDWLKSPTSDWQTPDPESSAPYIAALSASAADTTSLDPAAAATTL